MPNKVRFNTELPVIERSDALWARAEPLIPAGTQTLAKGPTQFSKGVAPKYLRRGKGARVWDVDGNEYLDYHMGVGPIILGYCHPDVDRAIREQLDDGVTFSLMHPLEVELAELIRDCVPNVGSVRFSKTGCDVTSAAVRLARAFTRREKVLCCGYHGWHDWYITVTDRSAGIPAGTAELTHTFNYNDIDSVAESMDADTACVILEPFVFEQERDGFLRELRNLCDRNGSLLIFDEMWTGFRCALGGAQAFLGVRSDLSLFSKAMANGMPISAITGRSDVMSLLEKDVFFFTTFGGEALSLAASVACIKFIRDHGVIEHIAKIGRRLLDGLDAIIAELAIDYVSLAGYPFRTIMNFAPLAGDPLELKTLVQQELIRRGILWSGIHNLCFAHSEADIAYTLDAYRELLPILREAVASGDVKSYLEGETLQPVFRKTSHFDTKPMRRKGGATDCRIRVMSTTIASKARPIRLLLTDCDGVLTDGGVYYSDQGERLKKFNLRDGMGVERLRRLAGVETGMITGETSPSLQKRADKLGIVECHLGVKNKAAVLKSIVARLDVPLTAIAYIGDDVNDLEIFLLVGLSACPNDAMEEVKKSVQFVCRSKGGEGAFREFAELIVAAQVAAESS